MRSIHLFTVLASVACGASSNGDGNGRGDGDAQALVGEVGPAVGRLMIDALFGAAGKPAVETHTANCPKGGTIAMSGNTTSYGTTVDFTGSATATSCAADIFVVSGTARITAAKSPSQAQVILYGANLTVDVGGAHHTVTAEQLIVTVTAAMTCVHGFMLTVDGAAIANLDAGDKGCTYEVP